MSKGALWPDWLCTEILSYEHHPERLRELVRTECRTRLIETPDAFPAYIVAARLPPETQARLDALLVLDAESEEEELPLNLVRRDPGPVGVESATSEITQLQSLRAIGFPPDLFAGYPPKLVERLRRRLTAESPSHLRNHPQAISMTL